MNGSAKKVTDNIKTKTVFTDDGAAGMLKRYLETEMSGVKPYVICDENTVKYADAYLSGIERYVYPPDQHATPEAAELSYSDMKLRGSGAVIACGSGSIHDITRYAAEKAGIPVISFPTAPSVDGFASSMAAMTIGGQKLTVPSHTPVALFAEPDVYCDAPMSLAASGVGDILGKYVCIFDWKVAHLLTGERYEREIENTERQALDMLTGSDLGGREFVKKLMEALVLSGTAIQQFGNTRPASGSEHHLSHFWEMHCVNPPTDALHGEQVGVATLILLDLYRGTEHLTLTKKPLSDEYLRPVYGDLTPGIIKENIPFLPDTITQKKLDENWETIRNLALTELPEPEKVASVLREYGGKTTIKSLGLPDTEEFLSVTLKYAPYVRNRLTLLKLL